MDGAREEVRPWALVTGASAGIGSGYARFLAARGYPVILVARRLDRLETLAADIEQAQDVCVRCCPCDLADPKAVTALAESIDVPVGVLVNNAGYAIEEYFLETDWTTQRDLLEVMAIAPLRLSQALAPGMVERGWGRIINVASLAAFVPETPGSLYSPMKSFMVANSRMLSRELAGTGVHVTALCPGFTRTEFHDVLGNREEVDRMPGWMWGEVEPVIQAGWAAVEKGREVCVPRLANRVIRMAMSVMPEWIQRRLPHTRRPDRRP
ncbi:MAG: SDR family oxidoreductase [Phycisphaerales bacterium]|nr:SDR family oxidoreductase [Phycisphaerales bacterium]